MGMRTLFIVAILFFPAVLLAESELEKTMKEMRLAYKELKRSLSAPSTESASEPVERLLRIVKRAEEVQLDQRDDEYRKNLKELRKNGEALLSWDNNEDELKIKIRTVRESCVSCHKAFMNPVKRFFVDITF